jgi:hypothetical protein
VQVVVVEHVRGHRQPAGGGQRLGDGQQLVPASGERDSDGVEEGSVGELEILAGGFERRRPRRERVRYRAPRSAGCGVQGGVTRLPARLSGRGAWARRPARPGDRPNRVDAIRDETIKNESHSVTAEIVAPDSGGKGVLIAQGGAFAGWSLYLHDGKPKYCHNLAGLARQYVESETAVEAGEHQVRMEFAYAGGGLGKGGTVTLFIDGEQVGEGQIGATVPMLYSGDETCDVGYDSGTPVSDDYTSQDGNFNGNVKWVQPDAGLDDHDHLISPEERLRVAMAIQ